MVLGLSLAALVGTIGALVLTLAISRRRRRDLRYQTRSKTFFDAGDPLPEGARMLLEEKPIERLVRTTFVVWNAGTEMLQREDLMEESELGVEFDPAPAVATWRIVARTQEENGVVLGETAEREGRLFQGIRFEYLSAGNVLEAGDGFGVEVIHSSQAEPNLVGTVRGLLRGGPRDMGRLVYGMDDSEFVVWTDLRRTIARVVLPVLLAATFIMVVVMMWEQAVGVEQGVAGWVAVIGRVASHVMVGGFVFYVFWSTVAPFWTNRRRCPKVLLEAVSRRG